MSVERRVSVVDSSDAPSGGYSPWTRFSQEQWGTLRGSTPLTLSEDDLDQLRGLNERVDLDEVVEIYLPLSRLLSLYVAAVQDLYKVTGRFLGRREAKVPYIIGIAGSVAVGKSTTARILQALLARWPNHRKVDLVTTDGFLFPNHMLDERGLMTRKGFPESYDVGRLIRFLSDIKAGRPQVRAPVYSHLQYDVLDDEMIEVDSPDIVIVEGLNVLQSPGMGSRRTSRSASERCDDQVFVSDFFDFSIYVDAHEAVIKEWYVERFLTLRKTAFRDEASFFHRYASLSEDEAIDLAESIWESINGINLREHILPTKNRADLILQKAPDHSIHSVLLRKI